MAAGLLDFFNDPQGREILGLLSASRPRPGPRDTAGGLLGVMNQSAAYQQAQEDRQRALAMEALKSKLLEAQIGETQAQAGERMSKVEQARRQAEAEQAFQSDLLPRVAGPQQAMAGGGGPTPANAARMGQTQMPDFQMLALKYPAQAKLLEQLAGAKNWGRDEVARTIDTTDARGMPATAQIGKYGERIGDTLPKAIEMKLANLGGSEQAYNPFALLQGQQFQRTQSPDSQALNAVAWANNALARQRLALDQAAPKGQYDSERGVMVDPRTGVATPVMQGGQPLGAKNKELTDSQAKALLFGTRMKESDALLSEMSKAGVDRPGQIKAAAERVPFVGGVLGDSINALPGFMGGPSGQQQQVEQAQRDFVNATLRRESGAVISQPEFDNAKKQYFPQVGDAPAVLAQKARNRELAIRGILAEVPENKRALPGTQSPAAAPGGLKFLGFE